MSAMQLKFLPAFFENIKETRKSYMRVIGIMLADTAFLPIKRSIPVFNFPLL